MKAKKHNSKMLQDILDDISPLEMEQTKVKMKLAARIEDLVKAKGWNKSKFAEIVGKNNSEITKWFSGTQNFETDTLTEISFALGVNVYGLFADRIWEQQKMLGKLKIFYVIKTAPEIDFCDKTFDSVSSAELYLAENVNDNHDYLIFEIKRCYIKS